MPVCLSVISGTRLPGTESRSCLSRYLWQESAVLNYANGEIQYICTRLSPVLRASGQTLGVTRSVFPSVLSRESWIHGAGLKLWDTVCWAQSPQGCCGGGVPPVRAGAAQPAPKPVLSPSVIMELLPPTPVILVTELCINLTHSLNPDVYKYVRNTNSSVLRGYHLSLPCVPERLRALCPGWMHPSKF